MAHHPSGETTSGTTSAPHEDSIASEVIVASVGASKQILGGQISNKSFFCLVR